MIKNSYRFLIIQLFLFLAVFNQNAISKTLPPGSGAGDVKANILILLDTSSLIFLDISKYIEIG